MTSPANSQLVQFLSVEHSELKNFLSLLEKEQSLLMDNLTQEVLELSARKASDAIELDQLAEKRRKLMYSLIAATGSKQNTEQPTQEQISAWLAQHSASALPLWQKIRGLAERAQQLNQVNGELIRMKLRHNRQALAALSVAADKANLYGPDGQQNFSSGKGRSLGSV